MATKSVSKAKTKRKTVVKKAVKVTEAELALLKEARAALKAVKAAKAAERKGSAKAVKVVEVVQSVQPLQPVQVEVTEAAPSVVDAAPAKVTSEQSALANAFITAIESTRPIVKKTVSDRVEKTAWSPRDGSPVVKLRRKMFQHGIPIRGKVSNEERTLLNKVRQGIYCDGFVHVKLRKDRGLDIQYAVKTASQRLKLMNSYGITTFSGLLQRLIDEHASPVEYQHEKLEDYT